MIKLIFTCVCILFSLPGFARNYKAIEKQLQAYVRDKDARIGVAVVANDGKMFGVNMHKAFPMMSVMKFPLALAVTEIAREREYALSDSITVHAAQLHTDTYSPMLRKYSPEKDHRITLIELLNYSLSDSDNNACDILMEWIGGAVVVDDYLKKSGAKEIHVKWNEHAMHTDLSRCAENSSTPHAMAVLVDWFDRCCNDSDATTVKQIMESCKTGTDRLAKPFLATAAIVGHKTGTGDTIGNRIMAVNDVGYIRLPDGNRYVIAVFVADSGYSFEETSAIIASVSDIVWKGISVLKTL